ncbi:MAG: LPS assembly protein LptD [Candidatus Zapsychrus exili]|nr:LPS assembly protein LptD [Candidatus Zapsychrus exili]
MNIVRNKTFCLTCILVVSVSFLLFATNVFAQDKEPVEINGDIVEYSIDGNKVVAKGNVSIIHKGQTLFCDEVEFFRDTKIANAKGHVVLKSEQSEISGYKVTYNLNTGLGDFYNAKIVAHPYYGEGDKATKVSKNKIVIDNGYITTSDYDKPGWRMKSNKIDVYPKDKIVGHNVKWIVGKLPLMYFTKYTQNLKDRRSRWVLTPGYYKDWGIFLLSTYMYDFSENLKASIHLDIRERKDFASGIDLEYKIPNMGDGIIRTYYMHERAIDASRFWKIRATPTVETERYKVEWRHKWDIDKRTQAVLQYYMTSDTNFLKDYFEKEYEEDGQPSTFFVLTKNFDRSSLTFRTDLRVNRHQSAVERLPEITYNMPNREILDTGFYYKNTTSFAKLARKTASPSEARLNTTRFDTDNQISYPMKIAFLEVNPFVGTQQTYYSKTKYTSKYDVIRGIFKTGATVSTKFYKIFEVYKRVLGIDIEKARHIITPTISYNYTNYPTILPADLDQYDSIDALNNVHNINLSIENKLQVKNGGETVDLIRCILATDYKLKQDPADSGLDGITLDIDFKPKEWLEFYIDAAYDTHKETLSTANFEAYINNGDKWEFNISNRYTNNADNQISTEISYRFNKKWKLELIQHFDSDVRSMKEQQHTLTRDLHSWEMDFSFREKRGDGKEFLLVFRLKAFPNIGFDIGSSFNKRKAGSQSE